MTAPATQPAPPWSFDARPCPGEPRHVAPPATLIPGDGIGPEIVDAAVLVLDALGAPFAWDVQQAGLAGIAAHGDPLPSTTLASIRNTRLAY